MGVDVNGRDFVGDACTLDGHPARVVGRLNRFGTVAATDGSGLSADFSWPTIYLVMTDPDSVGAFRVGESRGPRSLATAIARVEKFANEERLSESFKADLLAVVRAAKKGGK